MDPTTTLFTFMLQTKPSVQAVHLIGSWDNFSQTYSMQRDGRRDRGQWRGCYSFKDIICDGDCATRSRRDGGLKMGQTYYFYYELDGSTETFDPSLPSTNACPYLPGQTVNSLWVPVEHSSRRRSASLSSMSNSDIKTMNPDDRFATPRPAPSPPTACDAYRLGTAPAMVPCKRPARSLSPAWSWSFSPRRLFSRKASSSSMRESGRASPRDVRPPTPTDDFVSAPSATSRGRRSRDMSPESLRRFLLEDSAAAPEPAEAVNLSSLAIPEDIAEEFEDDDNFATSTTSERVPFTILSPPPTQHSHSSNLAVPPTQEPPAELAYPCPPTYPPPQPPSIANTAVPAAPSYCPPPIPSTFAPTSPRSPQLPPEAHDLPSFYHSDDDGDGDDDDASPIEDDWFLPPAHLLGAVNLGATLSAYSLPLSSAGSKPAEERPAGGSPALVARNGNDVPIGNALLLASPIPNSGLDDLVSELGWIADVVRGEVV